MAVAAPAATLAAAGTLTTGSGPAAEVLVPPPAGAVVPVPLLPLAGGGLETLVGPLPAPTTSISSGSLPRLTVMLPVLPALWMDDVPVTGSNTWICDAAEPRLSVTAWLPAASFHSASQSLPSDFCSSSVLSPPAVPLSE